MTIDELHDFCRYLSDLHRQHGVPDLYVEGYTTALAIVMYKCHCGLSQRDRKDIAAWREKHWKDAK